jgi:hypothetical protein
VPHDDVGLATPLDPVEYIGEPARRLGGAQLFERSHKISRRVLIFSPAGMEDFFLEAGAASPDAAFDPTPTAAAVARHGWQFVA